MFNCFGWCFKNNKPNEPIENLKIHDTLNHRRATCESLYDSDDKRMHVLNFNIALHTMPPEFYKELENEILSSHPLYWNIIYSRKSLRVIDKAVILASRAGHSKEIIKDAQKSKYTFKAARTALKSYMFAKEDFMEKIKIKIK
jgi:hypothetical protein